MAVTVVTDSSARLGPDELQRWGIRQVPLHVLIDGEDLRDGIDPVPYDVHDRAHVTTAGAAPADLTEAYRKALADSGGDGVVAVHLSAALSSTFSAAAGVAREFGSAVRVVHRLDNLRRSGRIGTAASWLGTALSLKPLLCLDVDGRLVLSQRIRTLSKAHAAMVEAIAEFVGDRRASIVVHHVDNHDDADEIGAILTTRLPQVESLAVTDMGPVLSVHVGGGAIGVCVTVDA